MQYRYLGRTGVQLSALGYGTYVSFRSDADYGRLRDCMSAAFEGGINYFDNADVYAAGEAERLMGKALAELRWPRDAYVISTKVFFGTAEGPNRTRSLSRKALTHAVDASLERLGLDFVDLIICHRADPTTPVEETVWALNTIIESGRALYWGTSEWPVEAIRAAHDVAVSGRLHKPVSEQLEYNLVARHKVDRDYAAVTQELPIGITTWSPLAGGLLSGKYTGGAPEGSRATIAGADFVSQAAAHRLASETADPAKSRVVDELRQRADELGCTPAQMALAWCLANPTVASVITGASRPEQITENLAAFDVLERCPDIRRLLGGVSAG